MQTVVSLKLIGGTGQEGVEQAELKVEQVAEQGRVPVVGSVVFVLESTAGGRPSVLSLVVIECVRELPVDAPESKQEREQGDADEKPRADTGLRPRYGQRAAQDRNSDRESLDCPRPPVDHGRWLQWVRCAGLWRRGYPQNEGLARGF